MTSLRLIAISICFGVMLNAAGIAVVKAEYGAAGRAAAETGFEVDDYDVTKKISSLLEKGERRIKVTGDVFGDPAPMVAKTLRVTVVYNGTPLSLQVAEGGVLDLDEKKLSILAAQVALAASYSGPVKIVKAEYGAGGRSTDVSNQVKAQLAGNSGHIGIGNNMFGDPAPGAKKELKIMVEYNGNAMILRGTEGAQLDLSEKRIAVLAAQAIQSAAYRGPVEIIQAEYGSQEKKIDVATTVRALLAIGEDRIKVNNGNFGEPVPRTKKILYLVVRYRNSTLNLQADENTVLDLSEEKMADRLNP